MSAAAQRLDAWLWCMRLARSRAECARIIAAGHVRINRQPTDKAHARVRVGDVLTLPWRGDIAVVRVLALALRRGPAAEAHSLFELVQETASSVMALPDPPCTAT